MENYKIFEPSFKLNIETEFKKIKSKEYILILWNNDYTNYEFCYICKFNKILFDSNSSRFIFKIENKISKTDSMELLKINIPLNAFYETTNYDPINIIHKKKFKYSNISNKVILNMNFSFDEEILSEIDYDDKFLKIYPNDQNNLKKIKNLIKIKLLNIKESFENLNNEQKNEFIDWIKKIDLNSN